VTIETTSASGPSAKYRDVRLESGMRAIIDIGRIPKSGYMMRVKRCNGKTLIRSVI
jgi:hypothetical protein